MTSQFIIRAFKTERDFAALVALLGAVEAADGAGEDVSEETLREQLTWPDHDPARDRFVALGPDGAVVGYGAVFKTRSDPTADLYVATHPAWRGQGIGAALIEQALAWAREAGATRARTYADANHTSATTFLVTRGFQPVSAYHRLLLAPTVTLPDPEWPFPVALRTYAEIQARASDPLSAVTAFTEACNEGYTELWGHRAMSVEEVSEWLPSLPADGIFLLYPQDSTDDARPIGTCRAFPDTRLSAQRGTPALLVDAPGIVPAYRERGLYVPLLLAALEASRSRTAPERVEMESWGDSDTVIAAYLALGFTVLQRQISYQRSL